MVKISQFDVLLAIKKIGGKKNYVTVNQLMKITGMNSNQVSRHCQRLAHANFVERSFEHDNPLNKSYKRLKVKYLKGVNKKGELE